MEITVCPTCIDEICKEGCIPGNYFIDICRYFISNIQFVNYGGKKGKGCALTSYLESKGFIKTTEADRKFIRIVPRGVYLQEDGVYICPLYDQHKEKTPNLSLGVKVS